MLSITAKKRAQVLFLHRSRQALRLAQVVAAGQDRANQVRIFVGKVGVQSDQDRGQAAVDGGGLEALAELLAADETVDVAER